MQEEITSAQAAEIAGVSDRTIRNWITSGKLAARQDHSGRKIRKLDLMALLQANGCATERCSATTETTPRSTMECASETPETASGLSGNITGDFPEDSSAHSKSVAALMELLATERERSDRALELADKLQHQNLELAGRCGYLQAKLEAAEKQVLALTAPPEPERPHAPWWKRILGLSPAA